MTLIILLILVLVLLQLPSIQTYVVNKVNYSLSQKLGNKINVQDVDINFFNNIDLNGIYIEDQNSDTLAYIQSVNVSASLISLLQTSLVIKSASIDGANIQLKKRVNSEVFNYQFIIDAFSNKETDTEKTNANNFELDIDQINLSNTHISLLDESSPSELNINLDNAKININTFDLASNQYGIDDLILDKIKLRFISVKEKTTVNSEITFPALPVNLSIDNISISDSEVAIKTGNNKAKKGKLAPEDLSISNLQFKGRDFKINDSLISGEILNLEGKEQSGLELQNCKVAFAVDNKNIKIQNLEINTPNSKIINSTLLEFSNFSDLNKINRLKLSTRFENTSIGLRDAKLFADLKSKLVTQRSLDSEKITIRGKIEGTTNYLEFYKLNLRIPSVIDLKMNGHIKNILDKERFAFNIKIDELETSAAKLNKVLANNIIPQELGTFGTSNLKGNFVGNLDQFSVDKMELTTSANTSAALSGTIKNVLDPSSLFLDVNIKEVNTHIDDIKELIKGDLPTAVKESGKINYTGKFNGTLSKFDLNGNLNTDIGDAITNIALNFSSDYKDAEYDGSVTLNNFDLGSALNNSDFGQINLDITSNGSGLNFDSLDNQVIAKVSSFEYKNIVYENFEFNGAISKKKINGNFNIDNKNAKAQFEGILDLRTEQPKMDFQLAVDTIQLKPLNISKEDYAFSGMTRVIGEGKTLDDFMGNIKINNLYLSKDTLNYQSDSLLINSIVNNKATRNLKLEANGVNAEIIGTYSLINLPVYINNLIDQYIPIDWFSELAAKSNIDLNDPVELQASVNVIDEKLIRLFIPKLEKLDTLEVVATFNSLSDSLKVNSKVSSITYDGISSRDILIDTKSKRKSIQNRITIKDIDGIGNLFLPNTTINARLQKDSFLMRLDVKNDISENILNIAAALTKEEELYKVNFRDFLKLDSARWNITPDNYIKFDQNYLDVNSLNITKDAQRLTIASEENNVDGQKPVLIDIENFDIHELTNLLALENDYLFGTANANITLEDLLSEIKYSGKMDISDIIIEEQNIGNLNLSAKKRDNGQIIDLVVGLDGANNEFKGAGFIDLESRNLEFNSGFENLSLALFDPFLTNIISESKGTLGGDVFIEGTIDKPIINGNINTNELSTLVAFSNVRYHIDYQNIKIDNSKIIFYDVHLKDGFDKEAIVNGNINHSNFTSFRYDLTLVAKGFQVLNTSVEENPLFYGTIFLDADATISGPLNLPNLVVNAKSLKNSKFYLSPFIDSQTISQDDYIIFTNKSFNEIETETEIYELKNNLPLNLSLNLDLDPNTEFQFIIDPVSGDHLSCFGNSNLQVEILQNGDIEVYGTYIVESGKYNFSYDKVIKREFDIQSGGQVIFQGDPLLAQFDVKAVYNTKATPYALLNDTGSLSETEIEEVSKRTAVQILLNMSGSINDLDLDFDLNFPDDDFGSTTAVGRRLTEIDSNDEEMYNQVFGLLLLNSFIATNSSTVDINTGSNIVLSSVSSLVENRLNSLADNLIKGFEINVNVDSYNSSYISEGQSTNVTEFGLGVSKSLLNDRLTLKALGNVDVDNRTSSAAFSGIAGDFILEYKLNKKGNYLLTVFRKSDFNVLQDLNANKNGASISFKKNLYLKKAKSKSDEK